MKRVFVLTLIISLVFLSLPAGGENWFFDGELELYFEYHPAVSIPRGSLLFVHGLGGSTFSWRKTAPYLADAGYEVYAVDLPGFGKSPGADGLDLSRAGYARMLWGFWKEKSPPEPWYFIGHSMGGGVVVQMASMGKGEVEGLILVAPALQGQGGGFWANIFRWRPARKLGGWFMEKFFLNEERVEEILNSAYGREPTPEELSAYYEPLARPGALEFLFKMTADNRKARVEDPEIVREKTFFIWGEEDEWVPPPKDQKELEQFLSYELRTIPGGGHLVMETHWEETLGLILGFLGGAHNDPH